MTVFLRQSTAIDERIGPFVDVGDGFTPETAVTIAASDEAEILKANGAATVAMAGAFVAIASCDGWYDYTFSAGDTDTVGELVVVMQDDSVYLPVFMRFQVLEEAIYDALFGAAATGFDASGRVDVGTWLGAAPNALVSSRVDVSVGAMAANVLTASAIAANAIGASELATDAIGDAQIATGAIASTAFAAGAINAAAIAAAAIGSSELADGAITGAKFAAGAITATAIAAGAIGVSEAPNLDAAISSRIPTANQPANWSSMVISGGGVVDVNVQTLVTAAIDSILSSVNGTADAGSTAASLVDAARTETVTDYWQHAIVLMTSGVNVGQMRRVSAFTPATDTIIVNPAFKSTIGVGDTYRILQTGIADGLQPAVEGRETTDVAANGDVGANVQTWLGAAVVALISGRVDVSVGAMAANVLTSSAIAADAIGSSQIAAGAIGNTELASAAISSNTLAVAAITEIAEGVWGRDATLSQTQGTFGQAIGDPVADTDTIYGLLNTNLDALISSRATPAQVNTEVLDVLNTDTFAQPGQGAPPATATIREMLAYIYKFTRNRVTSIATEIRVFNDDGTTVDHKATISDDGTTFDRTEYISGP